MKLKSFSLTNFRGYRDAVKIEIENLTAFVGKNDIGKSTILEAMDIFFNNGNGSVKLDEKDLNISAKAEGADTYELSAVFTDLPSSVVLDSLHDTSFQDEYLLNSDGDLEIVKKYVGKKSKVYVRAYHPTNNNCKDLLQRNAGSLKKIIVDAGIECDNLSINAVMRKAIWQYYDQHGGLALNSVDIDVSKEDAKAIWEKIDKLLPLYCLFQADRKNNDDDSEIQDPLKQAVKIIFSNIDIQNKLADIAEHVRYQLQEVAGRTLEKLKEMDPTVAGSLHPEFPAVADLKWADVFKSVTISGDEGIPINKRGSGVKRLILLNFFRAQVEVRKSEESRSSIIYAIEEPETSQHSVNQKMLIDALIQLSKTENTQVIVTTHSGFVVKALTFDNIRVVSFDQQGCKIINKIQLPQLKYPSLNEINYVAFGDLSVEYHNELYGYIEYQGWKNEYEADKQKIPYKKIKGTVHSSSVKEQNICLTEYIRHQIHHPENKENVLYTKEQLEESIKNMRNFIDSKKL